MTCAPPPPQASCLPCQLDPERWFDPHDRTDAVGDCRSCPARRWCAREALQCRASWGLWAGVWIDGRHEDAVPHLQAVATGALARSAALAAVFSDEESEDIADTDDPGRVSEPLHRPHGSSRPRSAQTAVLARSSGHCEVFGEGCRYTYERLVSRRLAMPRDETVTAPALFAACSVCADMVAALDPKLAAQFGYLVDAKRDPANVPFHWRRSRWVLLDRGGWLTEISDDAQTA
jgi:hypothetical protein